VHGVRLFRKLLHHPPRTVYILIFFCSFFCEKPSLDINTVLMGKRFEEETSLTSALRWDESRWENKRKKNTSIRKKLQGISNNETTLASRERRKRQTGLCMKNPCVHRVLSFAINYIKASWAALLSVILLNTTAGWTKSRIPHNPSSSSVFSKCVNSDFKSMNAVKRIRMLHPFRG